ncbi:uncharacterized protein LAESUDRAFT_446107 [Laetiporus sulphureus 93-53]|uniref:Uncharacterized protein n=1 Tax=Laetiporus sulphureus 93-53 TaxID=1314785 RepID=A0A165C1C0_9APHY|nr:uncharacterized protein LAESUDRAFT_446107 [Laetiporus sulphureus 93-53]KZT02021.1 hypothetical protein LAESUDRAFT_446107 [Laetiporus sulphureus 93-53]
MEQYFSHNFRRLNGGLCGIYPDPFGVQSRRHIGYFRAELGVRTVILNQRIDVTMHLLRHCWTRSAVQIICGSTANKRQWPKCDGLRPPDSLSERMSGLRSCCQPDFRPGSVSCTGRCQSHMTRHAARTGSRNAIVCAIRARRHPTVDHHTHASDAQLTIAPSLSSISLSLGQPVSSTVSPRFKPAMIRTVMDRCGATFPQDQVSSIVNDVLNAVRLPHHSFGNTCDLFHVWNTCPRSRSPDVSPIMAPTFTALH